MSSARSGRPDSPTSSHPSRSPAAGSSCCTNAPSASSTTCAGSPCPRRSERSTPLGQGDAETFGFASAKALRCAPAPTEEVLAIELAPARQARAPRGRDPAAGLVALAGPLCDLVDPIDEDRPLGPDLDNVRGLIRPTAVPERATP